MKRTSRIAAFMLAATTAMSGLCVAGYTAVIAYADTDLNTFAKNLSIKDVFENRAGPQKGHCYNVYYREIRFDEYRLSRWVTSMHGLQLIGLMALGLDASDAVRNLAQSAKVHKLGFPVIVEGNCQNWTALSAPAAYTAAYDIVLTFQQDVADLVKSGQVKNSGFMYFPDGDLFEPVSN